MEIKTINPWKWQDQRNYVQAVEVKQVNGTLYCAGQTAINADGLSSDADMETQLAQAIQTWSNSLQRQATNAKTWYA